MTGFFLVCGDVSKWGVERNCFALPRQNVTLGLGNEKFYTGLGDLQVKICFLASSLFTLLVVQERVKIRTTNSFLS